MPLLLPLLKSAFVLFLAHTFPGLVIEPKTFRTAFCPL
jgi:hypothetical protein